jgi:hypothetical protein
MADIKPPAPRKPATDPLEARRLEQPCLRTIDLRPERGKRCRVYPHGGRNHWLDDVAIAAFEQALIEFKGRYTIGVFERTLASDDQSVVTTTTANPSSREPAVITDEAIRRIPFGYRPHRHESRMNFVSAITIEPDDGADKIAGKTLDLSLLGVRIQIAAEQTLVVNSDVHLHYDELQQRAGEPLGAIAYRVLGCEREGDRNSVRLKRLMRAGEQTFDAFVPGFIEQQTARYKLELKDALPATYARIYERLFSQSIGFAQAFFALGSGAPELLFVTTSTAWQREQNMQMLPAIAERIGSQLHAASLSLNGDNQPLHWWLRSDRGDYLVPASALTAARRNDWAMLAPQAVTIATLGQRQKTLDPLQIQQVLELLPDELAPIVLTWQQRLQRHAFALALVPLGPLPSAMTLPITPDWLREFALIPDRLEPQLPRAPLVSTGVRAGRKQERFRYQTPMLLHREDGRELAGESIDFSINGLGLELSSNLTLAARELVRVSFPVLQQKVKDPQELADQPYRVVRQQGYKLMLERDFRVVGHRAARFFAHIIQQNRGRLPVCYNEQQETAESNLSEQLLVHGLIGCPLFLARDADKHPQLLALAHRHGSAPMTPFDGSDANAVLAALADLPVLYDVLAGCCDAVGAVDHIVQRQLLLQLQPSPRWQVLAPDTERTSLLSLLKQGARLFQLILSPVPSLPSRELDDALMPILGNSRHQALVFRAELNRLVGVASLFELSKPARTALEQGLAL